ncbi:2-oxoglutarate ferredoxin oxidoreductase subunit gamma [bacterium BMS3Abin07]|nr:2-oxoglutarate ferredoxin oxidoreductase subunit gamma [bacterium BMS3Abin07]GBE31245.1 2-oxoglutarate ferredoxin oxidoreductase subunit gamma [bacterium BMS3Bbin05]
MIEERNVTWFPSYGAEMRGGTANCTVVISTELIGSPIVKTPDSMIILNQASMDKFRSCIANDGNLYYDSSLISDSVTRDNISAFAIPSSRIAGKLGNPRLSNMVLLGAFIISSHLISTDSVKQALKIIIPEERSALIEKNITAIEKGMEFAENQKSKD